MFEIKETTEQAAETAVASTELVTIDPTTYVAQVYRPFQARLADAIKAADAAVVKDGDVTLYKDATGAQHLITSKPGMEIAKAQRATFRAIRIEADKERAKRKAPILEIGKLLDSSYKSIETAVEPREELFDAAIKAEEKRIEDEKAAKIKAEAERQAAIQTKLDAIKGTPLKALNMTADEVANLLAELELVQPDKEVFGERYVEAELALETSVAQLKSMIEGKRAQEELARHLAEQRAEQERQAAEAARLQAEAEARAKAEREAEEAKARAELARQQEEIAAQRAEIARQQQEVERQQAELRQQQEAAAKAEALAKAQSDAEEKAKEEALWKKTGEEAAKNTTSEAAGDAVAGAQPAAVLQTEHAAPVAEVRQIRPTRPSDDQIIGVLALHFRVHESKVIEWLLDMDLNAAAERMAVNM